MGRSYVTYLWEYPIYIPPLFEYDRADEQRDAHPFAYLTTKATKLMTEDAAAKIVVFGDIMADMTMVLPVYPAEGGDSTARALIWGSGGTALNAASAFALLGGQVHLVGRVGSDPSAAIALRAARLAGVNLDLVQHDEQIATGLCSVMISPDGERTFFAFRGANVLFDVNMLPPALLDDASLVYVTAYTLLEETQRTAALYLVDMAFQRGIPIVLDLALPPLYHSRNIILSLLPRLWLLSLNEEELAVLLPGYSVFQALDKLLHMGIDSVALKRGPRGCMIAHDTERLDVLPPVVEAIDTNGCGDAFTTGCAWARLQGADLNACADVANLLGALTSMRPGSADALPTRDELLVYLDEELWWIIGEKSITP